MHRVVSLVQSPLRLLESDADYHATLAGGNGSPTLALDQILNAQLLRDAVLRGTREQRTASHGHSPRWVFMPSHSLPYRTAVVIRVGPAFCRSDDARPVVV